jgi:hypothetical protein
MASASTAHCRGFSCRVVAAVIAAGCVTISLGCAAGALALERGLAPPPAVSVQVGRVEIVALTEIIASSARPTRAYYSLWVFVRSGPADGPRARRKLEWGRRLVRLEVPDPTARDRLGGPRQRYSGGRND